MQGIFMEEVFHVGSLNPADKGFDSYEGSGLSVSRHPEEWMEIARLSGPVWSCHRRGNHFIDFYALTQTDRDVIVEWGVRMSWIDLVTSWRVSWEDEETGDTRYFTFYDEAKAQAEAEYYDSVPVRVENTPVSTERLQSRMLQRLRGVEAFDLLVVSYAEDVMKWDGVWWEDRLDPASLSAPRGVIVPSMIQSWSIKRRGRNR